MSYHKIVRVEVDDYDVTFFFDDSDEPFSAREFTEPSEIHRRLKQIESGIHWFNSMEERA